MANATPLCWLAAPSQAPIPDAIRRHEQKGGKNQPALSHTVRLSGRTRRFSSRPSASSDRMAVTCPAATRAIITASMRKVSPR